MKNIRKMVKFSVKGVPVLPLLMMGVITVAAVFIGSQTVTSSVVTSAGQLKLYSVPSATPVCPTTSTTLYTTENWVNASLVAGNPATWYGADKQFCPVNTSAATAYLLFNSGGINSFVITGTLPAGSSLYVAFRWNGHGWCALPVTGASANSISITTAGNLAITNACTPPAGAPGNYLTIPAGTTIDMVSFELVYTSAPVAGTSSFTDTVSAYSSTTG